MAKRKKRNPGPAPRASRATSKGGKSAKRATRAAAGGKASAGVARVADAAHLAGLSTELLAAELARRRSELPRLERRAAELRAELAQVEARIAALDGNGGSHAAAGSPRGRRGRPAGRATASSAEAGTPHAPRRRGGKPTLGEHIVDFLGSAGGVRAPSEIAEEAARRLGREVNTSLVVQVSATLRKLVNAGRVRQVGRGQYEIGAASAAAQVGGADAA